MFVGVIVLLQACAAAQPRNPDNVCDIFSEKRRWHKAALHAQKKWGTSMHIPMAVMYQESTFRAKAKPPRKKLLGIIPWRRISSAYGYAQVIDGTWQQYLRATGEYWRKRHKFADATDFIHWYMHEAIKRNGIAKGDAYNLYLNYHEGITGFARSSFLKKSWLLETADKVQSRSLRYQSQYEGCQATLRRGFFSRLLGR
jgi:hypothetical protein